MVGVYVGYYGLYEVRLFSANGNPDDPVIAAAGRLQGAIAGWVHQHGAWPWLAALALFALVALARRVADESQRRFDTSPCRSGHGGRRTIATPASAAATSPTRMPISGDTGAVDGRFPLRIAVLDDEDAERPATPVTTGMTVVPSAVWNGCP